MISYIRQSIAIFLISTLVAGPLSAAIISGFPSILSRALHDPPIAIRTQEEALSGALVSSPEHASLLASTILIRKELLSDPIAAPFFRRGHHDEDPLQVWRDSIQLLFHEIASPFPLISTILKQLDQETYSDHKRIIGEHHARVYHRMKQIEALSRQKELTLEALQAAVDSLCGDLSAFARDVRKLADTVLESSPENVGHLFQRLDLAWHRTNAFCKYFRSGDYRGTPESIQLQDSIAPLMYKRSGRTMNVHFPSEPVWIFADLDHLLGVWDNLIRNAIKVGARNIHFYISTTPYTIIVQVLDDGPGFDAGLPHIFDKGTSYTESTGLGLYLTRSIIEAVGGTIRAANRNDGVQGAIFTISFPRSSPSVVVAGEGHVRDLLKAA